MNSGKKRPLKLKRYLKQSHSPSPVCNLPDAGQKKIISNEQW